MIDATMNNLPPPHQNGDLMHSNPNCIPVHKGNESMLKEDVAMPRSQTITDDHNTNQIFDSQQQTSNAAEEALSVLKPCNSTSRKDSTESTATTIDTSEASSLETVGDDCDTNQDACFVTSQNNVDMISPVEVVDDYEKDGVCNCEFSEDREEFGKLRRLKKLHGRAEEQGMLVQAFTRRNERQNSMEPPLVVISGPPGSGKTALASSLREYLGSEAIFVTWKFDYVNLIPNILSPSLNQQTDRDENAPLSNANSGDGFMDFFRDLVHQADAHLYRDEICQAIREALDPTECAMMMDIIPALDHLIDLPPDTTPPTRVDSSGQHLITMPKLFRALCAPHRPLIICMDDIHCMDSCSSWFLQTILSDAPQNEGIFFLATCDSASLDLQQEQEREPQGELPKLLQQLSDAGTSVAHIGLEDLPQEIIHDMVADMLRIQPDECQEISRFVYEKSEGNAVYALELIRMLYETGILYHDTDAQEWRIKTIGDAADTCNDVVCCLSDHLKDEDDCASLLLRTMRHLPQQVQEMLKAASAIGSRLSEDVLSVIFSTPVSMYLEAAEQIALIAPLTHSRHDQPKSYRFSHAGVQEAAYNLIPENERAQFHLAVGRKLFKGFQKGPEDNIVDFDVMTSVILGQLKLGASAIRNVKEKQSIALMCLDEAKKQVEWSTFESAAAILDFGISLLGENGWREDYDLCLALHNAAAEVHYTSRNFCKAKKIAEVILDKARVFEDKFQAFSVKLYVMNASALMDDAITLALVVLAQLGVVFPKKPNEKHLKKEYAKIKLMLKGKSTDSLRQLPDMTEEKPLVILRFLNIIFSSSYVKRPYLAPLLASKMMEITLKHGICAISSYVFGVWGMLVSGYEHAIEEGARYGDLALEILDRFQSKEWLPRVYTVVHGCTYPWTRPIRTWVEEIHRATRVSFETGDLEFAIINMELLTSTLINTGVPLREVQRQVMPNLEEFGPIAKHIKLAFSPGISMFTAFTSKDGLAAYNDYIQQELERFGDISEFLFDCIFRDAWSRYQRVLVAYMFGHFDVACENAIETRAFVSLPFASINEVSYFRFMDALSHIAQYRNTRTTGSGKSLFGKSRRGPGRKLKSLIEENLKLLSCYAKSSPQCCLGKTFLLEAEWSAIRGKDDAYANYVAAIGCFQVESMLWEQAMANELCGKYLLTAKQKNRREEARGFLQEAMRIYTEWGGTGKTESLQSELQTILGADHLSGRHNTSGPM